MYLIQTERSKSQIVSRISSKASSNCDKTYIRSWYISLSKHQAFVCYYCAIYCMITYHKEVTWSGIHLWGAHSNLYKFRSYTLSLSTIVLSSRDWPEKNGVWNFGLSKIHLWIGFTWKNRLKCIDTSIITLYLC